jgi:1-acyl-sn-glycerol-3-phosphate acyltransferase
MLPKTPSGKLRRLACRDAYRRGQLGRKRPAVALQWARLAARWVYFSIKQTAGHVARLGYAAYMYGMLIPVTLSCWMTMLLTSSGAQARRRMRRLSQLILRLALLRIEVRQTEELPSGPLIVAANHTSYFDAVVLAAAITRDLTFVAKRELFAVPILRTLLTRTGCVPVQRGNAIEAKADSVLIEASLRVGNVVVLFPEGTFTRARGLRPFRLGAFQIATQVGCPVVPVAIDGLRSFLLGFIPRLTHVRVEIGAAIFPANYDWHEVIRLRDATFANIKAHSGESPIDIRSAAIPSAKSGQ